MDEECTGILASRMAAMVVMFDRRCEHTGKELEKLAQDVPAAVRQSADEQLQRLSREIEARVRRGLEHPTADYEQRLHRAGEQLERASLTIAAQLQRAESLHRHLVWKVASTVVASLVLLFAGGAWLSAHYFREISRHQISAELLRAYDRADVTLCGGQLCARVNAKDKRFGEYLPVRPR
ncbi:hypothetical protein [Variovorax sp.]|uniref:hypothetical protein n=1 Tax=Variovorax sp. TaxID=1871043 RepID=UPI002D418118|nr:hypothetical protein [Variovorax sp.]HYP84123.1 hypothetical protein [Variovorax sp.]